MIQLTRLDKRTVCLNPDLVKSAEAIPDTIVTLTNGECFYVRESVGEVRERFMEYQRAIRSQRAQGVLPAALPAASPTGAAPVSDEAVEVCAQTPAASTGQPLEG